MLLGNMALIILIVHCAKKIVQVSFNVSHFFQEYSLPRTGYYCALS